MIDFKRYSLFKTNKNDEPQLEKEVEKRKKVEEHYKELSKGKKNAIIIAGPDLEEGPHSIIKEDQFFDAIDSTLDTLEQEEERVSR